MAVFVYRPDHPNADKFGMMPKEEAPPVSGVFTYWPDIPNYVSPLGTGEITSRSQRKEELKRHGLREVEPSEGPHRDGSRYQNQNFMRKHGISVRDER
jgi:hypothetical protein